MQYMYAALLLHSAGREITESNVESVLNAAGIKPEEIQVKALVAALADVNIDEALKTAAFVAAPAPAAVAPATPAAEEKKAEEKPKAEEKKEEDLQGLSALFG